jgi:Xaa-Pro aminopeptidase
MKTLIGLLIKKYFMHGHRITWDWHARLRHPNWTYESQIYSQLSLNLYSCRRIRIRLEDNIIVQESGEPFNMMRNIPIEVDEIEEWTHNK